MNESYKELLVKRDRGAKETLKRVVCVVPTVLVGLLTLLTGNIIFFIVVIALGVLDYFVFQWTDIEYEYLYLDKEISVDKIMAKTRRKKLTTISVDKIEIMAPEKSHQLDSYRKRQTKVTDLSAGHDLPDQKLYWVFYEGNQKILMNLTEDFAKTIKGIAPRKVFTE
ncbi:MAG: hypothetical protein K2N44_20095 [Lachnospiraceae bacterium]|nr:hypothetical protein [Lachnospiraceae bacterium]MDE7201767.1 hypothetical protein [Lachnospiraceae bacterium]MDE7418576.1 hypothetical protein [Lachnospiraceae bacterium]